MWRVREGACFLLSGTCSPHITGIPAECQGASHFLPVGRPASWALVSPTNRGKNVLNKDPHQGPWWP